MFVTREIAQKGMYGPKDKEGELVAKQRAAEPGPGNCNYKILHSVVLFQLRVQSIPGLTIWSQTESFTLSLVN